MVMNLSRETGLKSGTLYLILMRLAKCSLLETRWVMTEDGVPPRHTYGLTPKGIEAVRTIVGGDSFGLEGSSASAQRRRSVMAKAYPLPVAIKSRLDRRVCILGLGN